MDDLRFLVRHLKHQDVSSYPYSVVVKLCRQVHHYMLFCVINGPEKQFLNDGSLIEAFIYFCCRRELHLSTSHKLRFRLPTNQLSYRDRSNPPFPELDILVFHNKKWQVRDLVKFLQVHNQLSLCIHPNLLVYSQVLSLCALFLKNEVDRQPMLFMLRKI